jgi:hypothetical protein
MWTANKADMFGDKHLKYIHWFIELDHEIPMIWDDEFVRSCYHELQWVEIERRNFERATEPSLVLEMAPQEQNPPENQPPQVPIPNSDELQTQEPSLTDKQGGQLVTTPMIE